MSSSSKPKVLVAMSGGVDSSVAAALLQRQGYEVIGVFMRLGSPHGVEAPQEDACDITKPAKQGCCSVLDAGDARRVAGLLDIPFYVVNFQQDFGKVIDYFVAEYNRGRTPNPCVRCNDWLKFGRLTQYAKAFGAEFVASGHYARVEYDAAAGKKVIKRGKDHHKDQSYVLFGTSSESIQHTVLPIGQFEKHEVRQMAEDFKLPVFNKPDSQEICFVPDQDYAGLVRRRTPDAFSTGQFVTANGQVIGKHDGHQQFTIGQRRGLRIAVGHPIYVTRINPKTNDVTVGVKEELLKHQLTASELNFQVNRLKPNVPFKCSAKIRYNHQPQRCTARLTDEGKLEVTFDEAQSAITPGQAVVLYDDEVVLGGGWIDAAVD